MHLPKNTLLQGGKYRIVRFISSGGFGCTYEALHVMLEKRVAIKEFFVKDYCNRDGATSRVTVGTFSKKGLVEKLRCKFIDEAKSLCRLQHRGIVQVSDVFEENGTAYFVMDYIEGRSLGDMVRQEGALSEQRALKYIRQVADALQYVHGHNRLHLDIKPDNIMVDGNDRAILIDFGASKQYDEVDGENTSTLMGKTPGYAPLEQMGNDVVKFLPATDVYAMGATLYKLLTGVTPLSASLLASGEMLPSLPSCISAATGKAIASAMEISKRKRPQSVRDFISLFDKLTFPSEDMLVDGMEKSLIRIFGEKAINGHEYVDLGLSVKWATCNVGAVLPTDNGDYYAWGEISVKAIYTGENSIAFGREFGDISADFRYDVARKCWGGTWRLPTFDEIKELKEKCIWTWDIQCGHKGYSVVGPNGNSIFFPASGYRYGVLLNNAGERGYYWTAIPDNGNTRGAYALAIDSKQCDFHWGCRYYGHSVRPVSD